MHALLHGRVAEAMGLQRVPGYAAARGRRVSLWQLYSALRWGRFRAAPRLMPALWGVCGAAVVFGVWRNRGFDPPGPAPGFAAEVVPYLQEHVLKRGNVTPTVETQTPTWLVAVRAAESKKAADIKVLDLSGITSFADHFVLCTGANSRQVQAIADEVGSRMKQEAGELPSASKATFSGRVGAGRLRRPAGPRLLAKAREYYSLERLWRNAKNRSHPSRVRHLRRSTFISSVSPGCERHALPRTSPAARPLLPGGMREIHPHRFDPWRASLGPQDLSRPRRQAMDSPAFARLIARSELEARDGVFLMAATTASRPLAAPRRTSFCRCLPMTFPHRIRPRHAGRADLPGLATLRGQPYPR